METESFGLEFVPLRWTDTPIPYENGKFGRWPIAVRIKLNEVYLGDKVFSTEGKTQPSGDYFRESTFLDVGRYVLDGIKTNFVVGHSARIGLRFNYPSTKEVQISLSDKYPGRNTSFNPESVRPAILDREPVAFEFFKAQNDLFKDVLICKDEPTLEMLTYSQLEMHQNPRINNLFNRYGIELAQVPENEVPD